MNPTVACLSAVAALALTSCSSPQPLPPSATQSSATTSTAAPGLIDVGVLMETATGVVKIESIDATNRTLMLRRSDGASIRFKAGPEVRRFSQLKVEDQITITMTDNCTIFVVKGKMDPRIAASTAMVRTPEGDNPGGVIVNAVNINAKVLDVDRAARRVLLQYDPTQTKYVKVRPNVNLDNVAANDTVLVRGTETISILVSDP